MALRFCSRCQGEVEDAGGFCLLGHLLRLQPPTDSLPALRAEVDQAFEEARVAGAAFAPLPPPGGPLTAAAASIAPPPPPPEESVLAASLVGAMPLGSPDPITAFSPPPRMDWGPKRNGMLKRLSARRESPEPY